MSQQENDSYSQLFRLPVVRRFLKFGIVGLSGVGVNFGLLWGLTELAGWYYLHSSAVAIELSILSNFILNDTWTFRQQLSRSESFLVRALEFNLVYVGGLVINLSLLWLLTEQFGIYYLVANAVGIGCATLWNFVFCEKVIWA